MADVYKTLDDKPYGSKYAYFETTLDHPIEHVWPRALNLTSWLSDHKIETLAGEPGNVGFFERAYPRDLGEKVPEPRYHLYGIAEIIPRKLIAVEVFPEKGGSYGNPGENVSFDIILFTDLGDRTKLVFLLLDVNTGKKDEKLHEAVDDEEIIRDRVNRGFENLKELLEQDAAAHA